jgi:hypothetical protein
VWFTRERPHGFEFIQNPSPRAIAAAYISLKAVSPLSFTSRARMYVRGRGRDRYEKDMRRSDQVTKETHIEQVGGSAQSP